MSGRRIISAIVAWLIMFASFHAAFAAGEIGCWDARLDEVFSSGHASLREVPLAGIKLTTDDFELPVEYQDALREGTAELDAWLTTLYAVSVSPSGNSALLTDGAILVAWNGGKARLVQPDFTRGVGDEYGSFEKIWSRPIIHLLGSSACDIAWSPDGRYATLTNYKNVLLMLKMDSDPFLIDTETGDAFLVATYGTKIIGEQAAAPVAACFSRDGRYAYYMLYGNVSSSRTALLRCDLETMQTEICCSVSDTDYYPGLWELQDGTLAILKDVKPDYRKTMEHNCIAKYTQTGSGWMRFEETLPLEAIYTYSNRLQYSDASGYALLNTRVCYQSEVAFQCFRPDRGNAGLENYWAFDAESGSIVKLSTEDIRNLNTSAVSNDTALSAYETICNTALSPDGRYTVFRTMKNDPQDKAVHLRLVRLSDMAAIELTGFDVGDLSAVPVERSVVTWNSNALIIMLKNGLRSFVIE